MDFLQKFQENHVLEGKIDCFGKFDKIGYTSVKTLICHFCEKNIKNGAQRLELKTWLFGFFWKNPKVATLDCLQKIQETKSRSRKVQ